MERGRVNELEYSEMREGQKKDACKRGIIFSTTEFKLNRNGSEDMWGGEGKDNKK